MIHDMVRLRIIAVLNIAAVVFPCASYASSQKPIHSEATSGCDPYAFVKEDGWTIPGLRGAARKQHAKFGNIPGVYVTILEPVNVKTAATFGRCSEEGRAETEVIPIKITRLWSYKMDGRTFAYFVDYVDIFSGGASTMFFYDLDGSGRFTLARYPKNVRDSISPAFVPDWAKKDAQAPSTVVLADLVTKADSYDGKVIRVDACAVKGIEQFGLMQCELKPDFSPAVCLDDFEHALAEGRVLGHRGPIHPEPKRSPTEENLYKRLMRIRIGTRSAVKLEGEFQTSATDSFGPGCYRRILVHRVLSLTPYPR